MKGWLASRRIALLIGAAMVFPMAAGAIASPISSTRAAEPFSPPDGAMILTRTLRRPLSGGAEVTTRRSYEIRFLPEGEGYRVEGRLIDVAVTAPPALQPLAALEMERPDTGLFPMHLDPRGMLRPGDGPKHNPQVHQAGKRARNAIDTLPLEPFDHAQASEFARFFEQRSVHTAWPVDLFRPHPGQREETRLVPLTNGARGDVTIMTHAIADAPSGLISSFVRRITTALEGDHRVSEETWTLRKQL